MGWPFCAPPRSVFSEILQPGLASAPWTRFIAAVCRAPTGLRIKQRKPTPGTWRIINTDKRTPFSLYHCWDDPPVDHGCHSSIGIESIIRRKALRSMRMHSSGRQDRKGRASRKSASIMRRRTDLSLPFWLALVLCYRDGSHLGPSWGALAFSTRQTNARETRYFTEECLIPPIQRCSNESQTAADSINVEALPVVYTNDPKAVSRWIANHVPSEGCVLGFDLEVRKGVWRWESWIVRIVPSLFVVASYPPPTCAACVSRDD